MITPEMFAALSQQGFALSQKGFAEIELRARTKKALLDRLTEEELEWKPSEQEQHSDDQEESRRGARSRNPTGLLRNLHCHS